MQVGPASASALPGGGGSRKGRAGTALGAFLAAACVALVTGQACLAGQPAASGAGASQDTAAAPPLVPAGTPELPVAAAHPAFVLTVQRAQLTGEGSMLEVHFSVAGASRIPVEPAQTYVLDEESGQKLEVANLVRVGPLAQRRKRPEGSSFMVFDNRYGRLVHGARVSVVVGGLRQEHVVVE